MFPIEIEGKAFLKYQKKRRKAAPVLNLDRGFPFSDGDSPVKKVLFAVFLASRDAGQRFSLDSLGV